MALFVFGLSLLTLGILIGTGLGFVLSNHFRNISAEQVRTQADKAIVDVHNTVHAAVTKAVDAAKEVANSK